MSASDPPGFLDLPSRSAQPRTSGLTHVLDTGLPAEALRALLDTIGTFTDFWKFGFGIAYLDPALPAKLTLLKEHGITACVGGTLLEIAWLQGKAEQCLAWAAESGFSCIEVSNGAVAMDREEKRRLITRGTADFTVVSEVGSKDPSAPVKPEAWCDEMLGDLDAGAAFSLAEGRASGMVGLYESDGSVRDDVVELLVSTVGSEQIIFETPLHRQQSWFVRRLGAEVNLGNVAASEVLALEALRLGLRADTLHGAPAPSATSPSRDEDGTR
ncbi:MAG: phosphosulfolactate synthase [Egibacteraceae bacterium]